MFKDSTADSAVQRDVESLFRGLLSKKFGELPPARIKLGDDVTIQVDGYNESRKVYAEFYARQGVLLDGQRKKVAKDILKLALLRTTFSECTVIFCFANDDLETFLTGSSWLAKAVLAFEVYLINLNKEFPDETKSLLSATQQVQATNRKKTESEMSSAISKASSGSHTTMAAAG